MGNSHSGRVFTHKGGLSVLCVQQAAEGFVSLSHQIHLANKNNEKYMHLEISRTDLPSRVYAAIGI